MPANKILPTRHLSVDVAGNEQVVHDANGSVTSAMYFAGYSAETRAAVKQMLQIAADVVNEQGLLLKYAGYKHSQEDQLFWIFFRGLNLSTGEPVTFKKSAELNKLYEDKLFETYPDAPITDVHVSFIE